MLKLVNTLLDFSRIEAGRLQAVYQPVDLAAYTADLAGVFRSTIERAGLEFVVSCPPLEEPVYIDREMWEKIVFNLLSNAFKFTFEGRIEVALRRIDGNKVELTVADTGSGIPAAEIPHVFERFHRVRGAKGRTYEGTGIGLALVQELVRLHGGTVAVLSEEGKGTTFTVTVLLGREHLPPERIGAARNGLSTSVGIDVYIDEMQRWQPGEGDSDFVPLQPSESGADKPRVLLADDNAEMRSYVSRLLAPRYDVISVPDGVAALEAAKQQRPVLILSDIMMPRLDGVGLLEAIRADRELRSTPVILLSARAGEEARVEGLLAGADDYLVKPFSARELRVETHLQMTQVRSKLLASERSARAELEVEREILETVNRSGQMLSAQLDLEKTVQALTDAATQITGAQFGSFFYNVVDERGQSYMLYTLSGVSREHFKHLPMPRSTDLFGTTFRGEATVRIDDVKKDPRYGKNPPHYGMPKGHLPVTSYLAVPVISRSGKVLGGLFFGHSEPGVFSERHERMVEGLAGQAAIAMDNARLFKAGEKA